MAVAKVKYFSGLEELNDPHGLKNKEFESKFPGVKGMRYDSFSKFVGFDSSGQLRPVERKIDYKKNPSLHACGPRCMGAKPNGSCECSCGGKNHGVGSIAEE